jgi:hypothetical protein
LGITGGSQKIVMVGLGARIEVRSPARHEARAAQIKAGFQRVKGKVIA